MVRSKHTSDKQSLTNASNRNNPGIQAQTLIALPGRQHSDMPDWEGSFRIKSICKIGDYIEINFTNQVAIKVKWKGHPGSFLSLRE